MNVYLDNAATTPLDPEVLAEMLPLMERSFGNPSSIHGHGRTVKAAIEKARKKVAELLHTSPSEIFFTSGGTESDNAAIRCAIQTFGLRHAITSRLEHHAVLHTLEDLAHRGLIELSFVRHHADGSIDLQDLESLLRTHPASIVSLMHANNEIGNLLDWDTVAGLCRQYNAIFHSDTVQTVGHFRIDLQKTLVDSIVGAAHKFHGPKGVGFLYVRNDRKIQPFITGGAQERNMRGGTENVYGIVGLAKALEISMRDLDAHRSHLESLKSRMKAQLLDHIPGIAFNGQSGDVAQSLYTVLSVSLPPSEANDMMLMNLDIAGISCSGGSACSSGSSIGSHVLAALGHDPRRAAIRFSFSKYNTAEEVDFAVSKVAELYNQALV